MSEPVITELNEDQKKIVLENYATKSIPEIVPLVFPGSKADSRTAEGKAIKAFLAGIKLQAKTTSDAAASIKPNEVILTDEQKKKIEEMAPRVRKKGGALEVARILFNDSELTALHKPARAVFAYLKKVYPQGIDITDEPVEDTQWEPPNTLTALVGLVNDFVQKHDNSRTYNLTGIKPSERRCLEQLMVYMRAYRFKYVASQYDKKVDRELFLSTFIRWTHTKPDLTEIEVDQMISAAEETVNIAQIGRSIQRIDKMHEEIAAGEVFDDNGKKVKLGMADVELIGSVRTKYDMAKKRLQSLMDVLETARSERIKGQQQRVASVWDLLEPWMKDEGFRNRMLEAGEQEKLDDAAEVERLSGVEELVALISGQTKEEGKA